MPRICLHFPILWITRGLDRRVGEPGRRLPSHLLDDAPDCGDAVASLFGDELRGHLFLHDQMVYVVLQRTERKEGMT